MKKLLKSVCVLTAAGLCFGSLAACSGKGGEVETSASAEGELTAETKAASNSLVKFEMESGGSFIVELYPEYAPATCENFLKLVDSGFYDGLSFHRVVDNFMAQGGMSQTKQAETVVGEFYANGFTQNTLSLQRGVIAMARTPDFNSATSQFFICYTDCSGLDGQYAGFGKVIEGMEVIDAFLEVERAYNSMGEKASPTTPIIIKTAVRYTA